LRCIKLAIALSVSFGARLNVYRIVSFLREHWWEEVPARHGRLRCWSKTAGGCAADLCVWDGLLSVTVGSVDTQYRRVGLVQSTRQSDHHSALIHALSAYAGVVVAVVTATSRPPRVILSTVIPSVHSNGSDRTHRRRRSDQQSYLPRGANVHLRLSRGSLSIHESAPRTAFRSVLSVFAGLTVVINKPTQRPRNGRHL